MKSGNNNLDQMFNASINSNLFQDNKLISMNRPAIDSSKCKNCTTAASSFRQKQSIINGLAEKINKRNKYSKSVLITEKRQLKPPSQRRKDSNQNNNLTAAGSPRQ